MRTSKIHYWAAAALALSPHFSQPLVAQDEELKLDLYHSTDARTWQPQEIKPSDIVGGGIVVQREGERGMFRLQIASRYEAWGDQSNPAPIPVEQLPEHALRLADDMLTNLRGASWQEPIPEGEEELPEGTGDDGAIDSDTVLPAFAYPIFDPAINEGLEPAYFEFPLVRAGRVAGDLEPNPLLPNGPRPIGGECGLGFIRVSNSRQIEPVAAFATSGKSPVEELLQSLGGQTARPVLYNAGYLAGENPAGELIAAIGNHPFDVDIEPFMQLIESGGSYSGSDGDEEDPGEFPGYEGEPRRFASYQEFKDHHLNSPVLQYSRDRRAELAQRKWETQVDGNFPQTETIEVNETRNLLDGQNVIGININNDHRVAVDIVGGGGGISVTGLAVGDTLITAEISDGPPIEIIVLVTEPGARVVRSGNWTQLPYRYIGSRDWYRPVRYWQYENYSSLCRNGFSGCGPTAWAILYAHWDRNGVPQAMGDPNRADAPQSSTDGADLACVDYVSDQVSLWCDAFWSGQGLTWPWNLNRGANWGRQRGANIISRYTWGAVWGDAGARRIAIDAVKAGKVAITGVDAYQHYNVAVAYTQTIHRCGNHHYFGGEWLAFNNGGGSKHIIWRDANMVWWAAHTRMSPKN